MPLASNFCSLTLTLHTPNAASSCRERERKNIFPPAPVDELCLCVRLRQGNNTCLYATQNSSFLTWIAVNRETLLTKTAKEACGQIRVIVADKQKIIPSLGRKVIRCLNECCFCCRGEKGLFVLCGWWLNGGEFLANMGCPPPAHAVSLYKGTT